jgi:predicted acylesterase/phospholipase RssA
MPDRHRCCRRVVREVEQEDAMADKRVIALCCDGGGVRGLITTLLLQSLDPKFLQSVTLFAGTSTGSIIALGLAGGMSIDEIVALYQSMADCQKIFTPYLSAAEAQAVQQRAAESMAAVPIVRADAAGGIDWSKIWQMVLEAAAQMAYPKYQSTGLKALLSAQFPNMTLADLATQRRKYVVAPSFRITADSTGSWSPVLFHNLPGLTVTPELSGTSLLDAAMCSAAAPLFFPPHVVGGASFIDGGVFANNPSSTATAAYLASSVPASGGGELTVVSIGTGNVNNAYPPSDAIFPFGILGWMWPYQDQAAPSFPLIQAMFAGTSQIDDLTAGMLVGPQNYIRANPVFQQTWSLDDCASIPQMAALTAQYIASDAWKTIAAAINALAG